MQSLRETLTRSVPPPASTPPPLTLAPDGATERPVLPDSAGLIELTEAEYKAAVDPAVAQAVREAKQKKFDAIRVAQYWWDVSHPAQARKLALDDLGSAYLQRAKEAISPAYAVDNGLEDVLNSLTLYFADDEQFDQRGKGFSRTKGIFLVGGVGVGKTSMLRVWGQLNQRLRFGVVSCRKVADRFTEMGSEGLEIYCQRHHSGGVCFDDLGTEQLTTKHYGNEEAPLAKVLLDRYDEYQAGRLEGNATHLTSNLTFDQLRERYGDRVMSRIREMFNILPIPVGAPDRRA